MSCPSSPLDLLISGELSGVRHVWILHHCVFLRLKLYFAEMVDLVDLTCFAANHIRCDNYTTTYVDR